MITKPTVLILGAGASAPYGFPSGQTLKDLVCHGHDSTIQETGIDLKEYDRFKSALGRSGCSSVDTFLESRPEYVDLGKTAIANVLLPMEQTSKLFDEWASIRLQPDASKRHQGNWSWYDFLLGVLCDGVPFDEIGNNRLSVITFNYDRSFEHFLFTALQNRYGKPDNECAKVLGRIPVVHVYGSLGRLEWQEGANETNTVPYNSRGKTQYTQVAAKNITILHEGTEKTPEFTTARQLLDSAAQVFFLGFGYHPVNLQRLGIHVNGNPLPNETKGTTLRLSKERRDRFDELTRKTRGGGHRGGISVLADCDAYTLLSEHVTFS